MYQYIPVGDETLFSMQRVDKMFYIIRRVSTDTLQNKISTVCQLPISTCVIWNFQYHTMCEFEQVWDENRNIRPPVMMNTSKRKIPNVCNISISRRVRWKRIQRVKPQYGHVYNEKFYNIPRANTHKGNINIWAVRHVSIWARIKRNFLPDTTWPYAPVWEESSCSAPFVNMTRCHLNILRSILRVQMEAWQVIICTRAPRVIMDMCCVKIWTACHIWISPREAWHFCAVLLVTSLAPVGSSSVRLPRGNMDKYQTNICTVHTPV